MNANEADSMTPVQSGQVIPLGAGERARAWLAGLLDQVYQEYGQEALKSPLVQGLKAALPAVSLMVPQLRPVVGALSTLESSGPGFLVANLNLTDQDAVDMLGVVYVGLVNGYREILGVEIEAE